MRLMMNNEDEAARYLFQMLGLATTSREAIHYAWDLLTSPQDQGRYGFGKDTLWVTTYTDDDEARALWLRAWTLNMCRYVWKITSGLQEVRGPAGRAREIYVDRGPETMVGRRPHRFRTLY